MPEYINFNRFAERKKSLLISRVKQNIQNLLGDEILSKHIKERNYSLQKEIILKTLIQEFNGSDAKVKPKILHIIASHHNLKEWGSPIHPNSAESWIVHYADNISGKIG